jgi:hypothetical protein
MRSGLLMKTLDKYIRACGFNPAQMNGTERKYFRDKMKKIK